MPKYKNTLTGLTLDVPEGSFPSSQWQLIQETQPRQPINGQIQQSVAPAETFKMPAGYQAIPGAQYANMTNEQARAAQAQAYSNIKAINQGTPQAGLIGIPKTLPISATPQQASAQSLVTPPNVTYPIYTAPPEKAAYLPAGAVEFRQKFINSVIDNMRKGQNEETAIWQANNNLKTNFEGSILDELRPFWQDTKKTTLTSPSYFDDSKIPDSMKNSATWKNMTAEQKEFATFIYNTLNEQDIERQLAAKKALEEAVKISDPYFKQQLNLAIDELDAQIKNELATNKIKRDQLEARMKQIDESVITAEARLDIAEAERQLQEKESLRVTLDEAMRSKKSTEVQAASDVGKLQTRIDQIKEDLEFHRGELSIEQQADLARQMRQYEVQLENTQGQLVEAGLTYSTRRAVAERRLKEELQDMSMSTRRQFARQQRELEFGSQRGIEQAQTGILDTTRQAAERLASLQRGTESVVGSSRLPTGFEGIGGLRGTLGTQSEAERLRLSQQREDVLTGARQQKQDIGFGLAGTLEGERQRLEQIAREREAVTGDIARKKSEDARQAYLDALREQDYLRPRV